MTVHRVSRFGFVNAFLVEEPDGFTLIDTMLPGSAKAILKAADGREIKRIALTHAHRRPHRLARRAGGEAAGRGGADLPARRAPARQGHVARSRRGEGQAARRLQRREDEADPHRRARRADRLARGRRGPRPHAGQVAFLDTRDRTLYCGDAYATLGGVATTAKPFTRFPLPAKATWHHPTALESAKALRALEPARLAPGHGKVVESPRSAMDAAIARGSS